MICGLFSQVETSEKISESTFQKYVSYKEKDIFLSDLPIYLVRIIMNIKKMFIFSRQNHVFFSLVVTQICSIVATYLYQFINEVPNQMQAITLLSLLCDNCKVGPPVIPKT